MPTNILLSSLAITDILRSLTGNSLMATYQATMDNQRKCSVEATASFLSIALNLANVCILVSIGRDRYLHLRYGQRYDQFMGNKKIILTMFFLLISSVIIAGSHVLLVFLGMVQVAGRLFPVVVIAILLTMVTYYLRIWGLLKKTVNAGSVTEEDNRQSDKQDEDHKSNDDTQKKSHSRQMDDDDVFQQLDSSMRALEKRYIKSSLLVTGVFFFAWIPLIVAMAIRHTQPLNKQIVPAVPWALSALFSSGAVNPFIYAIRYQDIQQNLLKKLRHFLRMRVNRVSQIHCAIS